MADHEGVGPIEPIDSDEDPGPDITSTPQITPPTRLPSGGRPGRGRVTFGGDVEVQQASKLANQMLRSVQQQLHSASESVTYIRWEETEGSRYMEGDNEFAISSFDLHLSNGKKFHIEGPIMNIRIEG